MRDPKQDGSSLGISSGNSENSDLANSLIAARTGDEMAFAVIWRHHNPRLSRFVQSKTYGIDIDFEEVISDTWLNVAKDIRKFKGDFSEFTSWLYAIARNRIIDASRKRDRTIRPKEDLEEAFWLPSSLNVEKDFEADESVKALIAQINALPDAQSEVVLMRVVGELSVEEIAKIVKKNPNAVRVLAHRGLATLRENVKSSKGGSRE